MMCTWFFGEFHWSFYLAVLLWDYNLFGWLKWKDDWMDGWVKIDLTRQNGRGRKKKRKIDELGGVSNKRVQCSNKKRWLIKMKNIMTDLSESNRQKGKKWLSGSWSEKIEEFTKLTYCALHRASCIKCVHWSNHNHSSSDVYNHSLATRTAFLLIQLFLDFLF